jgi:hypothetical protein
MRLLRPDLLVTPTDDPPGCSVKDERSGQVYEFGAVERFLLAQLRRPYRTEAVAMFAPFGLRTRLRADSSRGALVLPPPVLG